MNQNSIDIKQLLYLIHEQKDTEINLNLDEGCIIETEDPKPLVKVLNYLINYLSQTTERAIEISLDLLPVTYRLSMLAYTPAEALPEISGQLQDALQVYNASYTVDHHLGSYVQLTIIFEK